MGKSILAMSAIPCVRSNVAVAKSMVVYGVLVVGDGCDKFCKKECGNGVLDALEQCDDGNRADADGYSSTCSLGNMVPNCFGSGGSAVAIIWPPNHGVQKFESPGVSYPDNDTLTVTITGITQNEATQLKRGDKFCPDASIVQQQQIRVERDCTSAEKNGRTYISFKADDGKGGQCSGTSTLCISHDQNHNCRAHEEIVIDSTQCPGYLTP
jgi:cysteine-rich repeat protein